MRALALGLVFSLPLPAQAEDMSLAEAYDRLSIFTYLLHAVDCYSTTPVAYSTSKPALDSFVQAALARLDGADEAPKNAALMRGGVLFEDAISRFGKAGYCEMAARDYGPGGRYYSDLIIPRRE